MSEKVLNSQWRNRRVAFLGDSITDAVHVGTTKNYWQFLHCRQIMALAHLESKHISL